MQYKNNNSFYKDLAKLSKNAAKKATVKVTKFADDAFEDVSGLTKKTNASTEKSVTESVREYSLNNGQQNQEADEEELKELDDRLLSLKLNTAMTSVRKTEIENFIKALGDSPCRLTDAKEKQIKDAFPIPREQDVLWADAEFDLRPSGIVATSKGVFIRTNVSLKDGKHGENKIEPEGLTPEEKELWKKHIEHFYMGKAVLLYYNWYDFEPGWFVGTSEMENMALLVEPQCSKKFIETCRSYSEKLKNENDLRVNLEYGKNDFYTKTINAGIVTGVGTMAAEKAVFVRQKAFINNPAGHGEMAEEAINILDRAHGLDAIVTGRDNALNGADRRIGDIFIQTKYYNSARGSLEACFSSENGQYRYMKNGNPMQLEVPKDQYDKVVEGFKRKIESGKVPGVSDPDKATEIVRKGRLTYKQAVHLTKAGTIESLAYDAATGIVLCSCAAGISFIFTYFMTLKRTGDKQYALEISVKEGIKIFGLTFIQHMLTSQFARTGLSKAFMRSNQLANMMKSNFISSGITFLVFSIPETYKLASRKISSAQYAKNLSVLAASIAGSVGGAVTAGIVASKIAGAVGTTVSPGVGTVVGVAGGFAGGFIGSQGAKMIADFLHEDDMEKNNRLFNAYVKYQMGEYFLDEKEMEKLIAKLDGIKPDKFKKFFEELQRAKNQEYVLDEFLIPYFDEVVAEREHVLLPEDDSIIKTMDVMLGGEAVFA